MTLPDLDIRTWLILILSAALLVVVLSVPWLRESVGAWLVWLGTLLGAGAQEKRRRKKPERPEPKPEPETAADEADAATDAAAEEEQDPSAAEVAEDINDITSEVD